MAGHSRLFAGQPVRTGAQMEIRRKRLVAIDRRRDANFAVIKKQKASAADGRRSNQNSGNNYYNNRSKQYFLPRPIMIKIRVYVYTSVRIQLVKRECLNDIIMHTVVGTSDVIIRRVRRKKN